MYQKLKEIVEEIKSLDSIESSSIFPVLVAFQSAFKEIEKPNIPENLYPLYVNVKDLYELQKGYLRLEKAVTNKTIDSANIENLKAQRADLESSKLSLEAQTIPLAESLIEEYHIYRSAMDRIAANYIPQSIQAKKTVLIEFKEFLNQPILKLVQEELKFLEYTKLNALKILKKLISAAAKEMSALNGYNFELNETSIATVEDMLETALENIKASQQKILLFNQANQEAETLQQKFDNTRASALTILQELDPSFLDNGENHFVLSTHISDQEILLTRRIEHINQIKTLISTYKSTVATVKDIRAKYGIMHPVNPDNLGAEFGLLQDKMEARRNELLKIKQLSDNCSFCCDDLQKIQQLERSLGNMDALIRSSEKKLKHSHASSSNINSIKLDLQNRLTTKVNTLLELNQKIEWESYDSELESAGISGLSEESEGLKEIKEDELTPSQIENYNHNYNDITKLHEKIQTVLEGEKCKLSEVDFITEQEKDCGSCFSPASGAAMSLEHAELQLKNLSSFEAWYLNLYEALPYNPYHPEYNQSVQLMRDIYFELSQPMPDNKFPVLEAYQKLCPNPENGQYTRLLQFKPKIMVENALIIQLNQVTYDNKDEIRDLLVALQNQISRLNQAYPREAALLGQLSNNLQNLALKIKNPCYESQQFSVEVNEDLEVPVTNLRNRKRKTSSLYELKHKSQFTFDDKQALLENIGDFQNDPRYESLHQHRGFHMLTEWFAKICVEIKSWFEEEKPKDKAYRELCFFKPTRSIELLQQLSDALVTNLNTKL